MKNAIHSSSTTAVGNIAMFLLLHLSLTKSHLGTRSHRDLSTVYACDVPLKRPSHALTKCCLLLHYSCSFVRDPMSILQSPRHLRGASRRGFGIYPSRLHPPFFWKVPRGRVYCRITVRAPTKTWYEGQVLVPIGGAQPSRRR